MVPIDSSRNHEVLPDCSSHGDVCQVIWEANDYKGVTGNFMYVLHSLIINPFAAGVVVGEVVVSLSGFLLAV